MKRLALVAVLCAAIPSTAAAQSVYVGAGVGPAVNMDDWPNQVRIELEIGAYFGGGPRGFFLSFAPAQSWGNDWWVLVFPLRLGAMFDIFRNADVSVQLGPTGAVGLALSDQFNTGDRPDLWFHFSVAFMLRILLMNDRLAIYLRPVGFEFAIGDTGRYGNEAIRYLAGAGINYYF